MAEVSLTDNESVIDAANETASVAPTTEFPKRSRHWSFQPTIKFRVVDRIIALNFNAETGCMEANESLTLNRSSLFEFLNGISDGELTSLQETIETVCTYVPVNHFSVQNLVLDKWGNIHFNVQFNPSERAESGVFTNLSLEQLEVSVSRTSH